MPAAPDSAPPVVVVGGGVVGAACAHYLADAGRRVTILEKGRFGAACSHGNCGLLTPSHVLPPAEPGVMGEALRNLFKKDAPLRLVPRPDPALWRWMLAFARRCNEPAALAAGRGIRPLLDSSRRLYDTLAGRELACEFAARGLLFAFRDPAAFAAFGHTNELLTTHFGAAAKKLVAPDLAAFEPALKSGLAGGWFYESDAHLRPDALMRSWRAALTSKGVNIVEGADVTGVRTDGGRVVGVTTAGGGVPASAAVIAAGVFAPRFRRALGCRVPVVPGKGYSLTLDLEAHGLDPAACPRVPLLLPEVRVAVTPHGGSKRADGTGDGPALRLGSVMEFAGYNASVPRRRLALLTRGASRFLNVPADPPADDGPDDRRWSGWRPMTPDGLPLVGPAPSGVRGLFVAAGHNMLGLSMAPATGKLVAELVTGAAPHLDPAPYAPGRFGRW